MADNDISFSITIDGDETKAVEAIERVKSQLSSLDDIGADQEVKPPVKPPEMSGFSEAQDSIENTKGAIEDTSGELDAFEENVGKSKKSLEDTFDGAALSLLFFGQQLNSIFRNIATGGIQTFNDVISKTQETSTNVDRLTGAYKFLQFQIGEALAPVVDFLTPIVISVADWVSENQKLTRNLVVAGVVIGGVLTTVSALKLAFDATADTVQRAATGLALFSGASKKSVKQAKGLRETFKLINTGALLTFAATLGKILLPLAALGLGIKAVTDRLNETEEGEKAASKSFGKLGDRLTGLVNSFLVSGAEFENFGELAETTTDFISIGLAGLVDIILEVIGRLVVFAEVIVRSFRVAGSSVVDLGKLFGDLLESVKPLGPALRGIARASIGDFAGAAQDIGTAISEFDVDDTINNLQNTFDNFDSSATQEEIDALTSTFDELDEDVEFTFAEGVADGIAERDFQRELDRVAKEQSDKETLKNPLLDTGNKDLASNVDFNLDDASGGRKSQQNIEQELKKNNSQQAETVGLLQENNDLVDEWIRQASKDTGQSRDFFDDIIRNADISR